MSYIESSKKKLPNGREQVIQVSESIGALLQRSSDLLDYFWSFEDSSDF